MKITMSTLMLIWLVLCSFGEPTKSESILFDQFVPKTPVLKSDVGLMSVNIPPVYIREQYWLHTLAIDMPCIDDVLTPDLIIMTNDMNYSTSAIIRMVSKIELDKLHIESKERMLGPLKSLNQTISIFLSHLSEVRKRYFQLKSGPINLWGLLSSHRCDNQNQADISKDEELVAKDAISRRRRQLPPMVDPNKHNVINVEGTGHTFIFNHAPLNPDDSGLYHNNLRQLQKVLTPTNRNSNALSEQVQNVEGQVFANYQAPSTNDGSVGQLACDVQVVNRIKYLTCVANQHKSESECYSKYMGCHRVSFRRKRGLFDFLGDIQNKLFGVATEEQITTLHDLIKDVENSTFRNSDEIKLLRNSTISMSNHIMTAMTNMAKEIYNELDKTTTSIHNWASGMETNIRRTEAAMQEVHLLSSISTSSMTLQSYTHILSSMLHALDATDNYYGLLALLANNKILHTKFVSTTYLNKLWDQVTSVLHDGLSMPVYGSKLEVAQNNIYQIYTTPRHMMVLFRFPITLHPSNLSFWDPRTVPIVRGTHAYTLQITNDILIINDVKAEWATIRYIDYILCMSHIDRVCEQTLIWTTFEHPNCHLSIHKTPIKEKKVCYVKEHAVDIADLPYAVPSDKRTWLMSSSSEDQTGILRCKGTKGLPSRVSTVVLPSLGLFQIPKHCLLEMGNKRIHSPLAEIGSSSQTISEILESVTYDDNIDIISNLTIEVPFLHNIQMEKFVPIKRAQDTLFHAELLEIQNLNQQMRKDGKLYDNDISKLQSTISEDENEYNLTISGIKSFFGDLSWAHLLIPIPSLFNCIVISWLLLLTWKMIMNRHTGAASGIAMSLLPESLMKHHSFASPITQHLNISSNTSCPSNHITSLSLTSYFLWVPTICLICMLLLHWNMRYLIIHYSKKTAIKVGWIPINKNNVQHAGENRLIIGILLKFASIFGQQLTRREIIIQVATLPGPCNSWYVDKPRDVKKQSIKGYFNRMTSKIKLMINWHNICIKSREFKDVDTCQELPKTISLDFDDIYCFTKHHLPFYWWSAEAEVITHISLSRSADSERLYDYVKGN